ncbi:pyrimidine reductase [Mariprofundus erugo]|uniref:Pyrimidine reductase n=1 Tax=Mariprofundus erugo TaxID=2528639 RepID=A0A5R9H3J0_9PROT|nr:dihydrofolate reductase family protein [Mariprofundus erugo]TLS69194.1 pyrimidine reductase [Mariprofundus erugo]
MSVQQLFPPGGQSRALHGLYLNNGLHRLAPENEIFIYANYIASLDGRIATLSDDGHEFVVPASIANPRDWRLYQELAAQSDIMLTSARYFRQQAKGCSQDLLSLGREENSTDLIMWRQQQGLQPQPDVLVISASLDIPPEQLRCLNDRQVLIATCTASDGARRAFFERQGYPVLLAGDVRVDGALLRRKLCERGYRSAYMVAGPEVHHTLLAAGALDALFLTTHLGLLGGEAFHTITYGALLQSTQLQLESLYLDQQPDSSQLFARYAIRYAAAGPEMLALNVVE